MHEEFEASRARKYNKFKPTSPKSTTKSVSCQKETVSLGSGSPLHFSVQLQLFARMQDFKAGDDLKVAIIGKGSWPKKV